MGGWVGAGIALALLTPMAITYLGPLVAAGVGADLGMIWLLFFALSPIGLVAGLAAVTLGVVGMLVGRRRGTGIRVSLVAVTLGVLAALPIFFTPLSPLARVLGS